MSRREPLFLLVCICTGSLFAQDVCNSEQTRVLEQIRVVWHESGRSLADGGHPRDGPKSRTRPLLFALFPWGSNTWEPAKFSRNCRTSPLGSNPKKTA